MDAYNDPLEQLRSTATITQSYASPLPTSDQLLRFTPSELQWGEITRRERARSRGTAATWVICLGLAIATFEPNINTWVKASPFGQFFSDGVAVEQIAMSTADGNKIVAIAEQWVGKEFNPGATAQCMYFVRHVLSEAGLEPGVTANPIDGYTTSEGYANSLAGADVGQLIESKDELRPGDLVMFSNTYGDWPDGTITHVAIYIGNGLMIDRPTASEPVQKRSISKFEFAVGVRLRSTLEPFVDTPGSDFDKAMAFIFKWEGGLSDHPNDAGGRTNMGITEERAKQHGLTPDEITKEKATEIYRSDYWDAAGCNEFEWPLSLACMNTAVNSGPGKAMEFNGLIGDGSAKEEAIAYAQRQEDYYRDIVSRKPDQEVFLKGWLNRSKDLKRRINKD
ncbi:glycosyl hydrolase 108 family protein [Roseofilum sp. BLCC_M154]|uniref:Glycosyl hydrolase 108 family protein n=1 Tax=Roseofilum acuticapitatum BLCC-M154 TaxID=3022444 RepID=A0ABT7AQV8_9CYAN|nr:glycosyl hydrolase 108 family protein [Roseofilum acuticapitatum]MDJ1168937.1 glycosyl hydrolase 108 family protein [Roseofilum acuticapitatum BLCC-M154]